MHIADKNFDSIRLRRVVAVLQSSGAQAQSADQLAQSTGVATRRVFDVTLVLDRLGLVTQPRPREYCWVGLTPLQLHVQQLLQQAAAPPSTAASEYAISTLNFRMLCVLTCDAPVSTPGGATSTEASDTITATTTTPAPRPQPRLADLADALVLQFVQKALCRVA